MGKQKKDAEIAEKRRKQKAEETAGSASEKRREKAGAVILQRKLPKQLEQENGGETVGQRNPQGNRVNRRIYDRYRIYRGNCGAGFMVLWGVRLRKNPPAYLQGRLSFRTKRAKRDADLWNYANTFFSHMILVAGVNGGLVSAVFLHRVYDFDRRSVLGGRGGFRFSVFRRRVYCFFIELRIFSSKNVPVSGG